MWKDCPFFKGSRQITASKAESSALSSLTQSLALSSDGSHWLVGVRALARPYQWFTGSPLQYQGKALKKAADK